MKKFIILLAGAMTVMAMQFATAQDEAPKPDKIFTTDQVIAATIDGPWKSIMRYKEQDRSWEGRFLFKSANGQQVTIPITITTRGLTRLRVCDFPPLRIEFDKEAAKGTEFRGAGNLKLVTHCLAQTRYEQYYIKEYLSYRIYNLVTPISYRVQGLDVKYVDGDPTDKGINRFAFLIEDPDDVAKRNDMVKLNIPDITPSRLNALEASRFMLFQYLVANLDWSTLSGPKDSCCHNARLIGAEDDLQVVYAIPYDLDASGLVDTHYAAPPDNLRVRSVKQRLYRGFCAHNGSVNEALEEYRALRPEIIALFENEERLDSRNRGSSTKFINGFYSSLESPKDVENRLIDNCRG
jgi:hypothetical protein